MDNKETKEVSLEEVNDDALENVAGGIDPAEPPVCKRCGTTEKVFVNTHLCHQCQIAEIKENPQKYLSLSTSLIHMDQAQNAGRNPASSNPELISSVARNQ